MSKQTILVTGSAGFIGFHLCKKLLELDYTVIGVDNFNNYYDAQLKINRTYILIKNKNFICLDTDINDYVYMEGIIKDYNISLICNLAAQAGVRKSLTEPFIYEQSNIAGFLTILELCKNYKIPRLIYASSGSVYGGNKKIPFCETDNVDTPISLYGATKRTNELMAYSYSHLFNIQTIGLRFFSVYGEWGRPDVALWLFTEAILNENPIDVYNHGNMKRDFTYIDDIIDGIISSLFAKNINKYEIFNLSSNKKENLLTMIEIIEKELGKKAIKNMLPMQLGDIPESFADIEKAQIKLNYHPQTTIFKGIPKFIKWYKQYHKIK